MRKRSLWRGLRRWGLLAGLAGPMCLWQTAGCAVDPDVLLRAGLQFVGETAIFALDNLLVGPR
ncbi:MAG: hypothetical protein HRF43_05935 [Phycisphaerae bacterium]